MKHGRDTAYHYHYMKSNPLDKKVYQPRYAADGNKDETGGEGEGVGKEGEDEEMPEEKNVFSVQRRQWKVRPAGGKLPMLRKVPVEEHRQQQQRQQQDQQQARHRARAKARPSHLGVAKVESTSLPLLSAAGISRAEAPTPIARVHGIQKGDGRSAADARVHTRRRRSGQRLYGRGGFLSDHEAAVHATAGQSWDSGVSRYRDVRVPTSRAGAVVPIDQLPKDLPDMAQGVEALLDPLETRVRQVQQRQSRLGSASDKVQAFPSPLLYLTAVPP